MKKIEKLNELIFDDPRTYSTAFAGAMDACPSYFGMNDDCDFVERSEFDEDAELPSPFTRFKCWMNEYDPSKSSGEVIVCGRDWRRNESN